MELILLIISLIIIGTIFIQANRWRAGKVKLSRRHFFIRLVSGVMVLIICLLALCSFRIENEYTALYLRMSCLPLAIGLIVLAFADFGELLKYWAEGKKKIIRELRQRPDENEK